MTTPTATPRAGGAPGPGRVRRLGRVPRGLRLPRPEALPPWLMGVLGALWAAVVGLGLALVPMVALWMASPDSGLTWTQALRLGGLLWVVAHGVPLTVAGLTISLLPWGLALVPLVLLGYAGGWAVRRSHVVDATSLWRVIAAGTAAYAASVGLVSVLTAEPASRTSWPMAVLHAALLALVALSWGALRAAGFRPLDRLARPASVAIRAGLVAAAALLAVGALAAALSLLTHVDDAVTMAQSLDGGIGGGLGLTALALGYVPVLVVWGTAYALGAGVVVGPGVTISPFLAVTEPTELPPFPLLAALPQGTAAAAWLLPLAGVAAGVLAGILIARRAREEQRLVRLAAAFGAAAVAGAALALAAALASGSLGTERLALLGPVPLTVGVLTAVLIGLGAVPSAVVPPSARRTRPVAAERSAGRARGPADPWAALSPTPEEEPRD